MQFIRSKCEEIEPWKKTRVPALIKWRKQQKKGDGDCETETDFLQALPFGFKNRGWHVCKFKDMVGL